MKWFTDKQKHKYLIVGINNQKPVIFRLND